jgi:hypothetical protein
MTMSSTVASVPAAEMADVVLKALERAPQPLSAYQLQGRLPSPYKRKPDEIRQCLSELAAQGKIHELPPYKSSLPRFWTRGLEQLAREEIVQLLAARPRTRTALLQAIKARVKGLSEGRFGQVLEQALRDGQVRKLPPQVGSRGHLLGVDAPHPDVYLGPLFENRILRGLEKVFRKLESEGVSQERILDTAAELWQQTLVKARALPPSSRPGPQTQAPDTGEAGSPDTGAPPQEAGTDGAFSGGATPAETTSATAGEARSAQAPVPDAQAILDGIVRLNPGASQGAMVSVRELRRSLRETFPDKDRFDRAVLELAREGRLDLHQHDYPASLGEEQRGEELIPDNRGNYYNGIVLRP